MATFFLASSLIIRTSYPGDMIFQKMKNTLEKYVQNLDTLVIIKKKNLDRFPCELVRPGN